MSSTSTEALNDYISNLEAANQQLESKITSLTQENKILKYNSNACGYMVSGYSIDMGLYPNGVGLVVRKQNGKYFSDIILKNECCIDNQRHTLLECMHHVISQTAIQTAIAFDLIELLNKKFPMYKYKTIGDGDKMHNAFYEGFDVYVNNKKFTRLDRLKQFIFGQ